MNGEYCPETVGESPETVGESPETVGEQKIPLSELSEFVDLLANRTFVDIESLEDNKPGPLADMHDQWQYRVEAAKFEGQSEILQKLRAFVTEKSNIE